MSDPVVNRIVEKLYGDDEPAVDPWAAVDAAHVREEVYQIIADLEGKVAAVRALHTMSGDVTCRHCDYSWPCPTLAALDPDAEVTAT